jgi:hypothetical protein
MGKHVQIENIEEMRRRVGIDDVELRHAIRGLRVGDLVKLTLLTGTTPPGAQTRLVRVTRITGSEFRGRLLDGRACPGRSGLRAGSRLAFTAAHIHSLPKGRLPHAQRRIRP